MSPLNGTEQRRLDALFVEIGRLEARSRNLARDLGQAPEKVGVREALGDVADSLYDTWKILSDRGYVR